MKTQKIILMLITISLQISWGISNEVEFRKYDLDSSPKDLIWCGKNSESAIVLTDMNSVYRSEDKGLTWKKLNDIFTSTAKDELEENENEIGRVSSIILSPSDKALVVFLGTHGINWIGENCGKSIKALNHGRKINEFVFHPTERDWGLASAYTLCKDFGNEPCKIYKELFLTKDMGKNWTQLAKYVVQFSWGVVERKQITKGVPKERILMTYEPRGEGDQRQKGWDYKIDFVYSDDFFKTIKIAAPKGNKFLLTGHYLFVAQVVDQETQEVLLLGTKSTHYNYHLLPIETNQSSFIEHSYTFLDTDLHSVFLHINHFGEASKYGHIYTSGPRGWKYNLSLKNNLRSDDNRCDFEKVNSIEGVYVANAISGKYMKLAKKEMENTAYNQNAGIGKHIDNTNQRGVNDKKNLSYKDYVKTLITFNKGGNWKRLIAPERDINGKRYDCGSYCFWNLFGLSSDNPPFYSVDSASGIIIGNGNIGHYLSNNNIATFLSRDGGWSWFEIQKGSHIYEIGDQGGWILIAEDQIPTNEIKYTWDEGLNWETLVISEEKFTIRNIIIEPESKSLNFIVYGETFKDGSKKGVVIGLNFSKTFAECRGPNAPDSPNSDYEKWSPSDGRAGRECLLGHKVTIIRKKHDARCVNSETFQRTIFRENCECTEEDYQCDLGFGRQEPGEPCTRIEEGTIEQYMVHKPPTNCEGVYTISKGYRKIPGDTCVRGVKYDPIVLPCPNSGLLSRSWVLLLLIVCVGCFLLYVAIKNNCECLDCLWDLGDYASSKIFKSKEPYQNVRLSNDEDNTLFDEDTHVLNPLESNIKHQK